MEKTCRYDICTGCLVCQTVCPKKCISTVKGEFGHILPKIDTAACIDCNMCRRVCPALTDNHLREPTVAWAGVNKNEEQYRTSTSGGAAMAIATMTLTEGGVVYGCASLPGVAIKHIRVDKTADLPKLQGSKYVQSDLTDIFTPLKADVKSGIPVAFFGTPCQCAAVKNMFKTQPENLLLVDLICHGVPSVEFLRKDLEHYGCQPAQVSRVSFRADNQFRLKAEQIKDSQVKVLYHSSSVFGPGRRDVYYDAFMRGYSFRDCCYACRFAGSSRGSDVTIGDFWGYGKMMPKPELTDHPMGLSVLLPVSSKGTDTVRLLGQSMELCARPLQEAVTGNAQLMHPFRKSAEIRMYRFMERYMGPFKAYYPFAAFHQAVRILKYPLRKIKHAIVKR